MSFRKTHSRDGAAVSSTTGTQASIYHSQLQISSGLDDLDKCIGGGFSLGNLCLVDEDINTQHFLTVEKYFIAEGSVCGNALFLASADILPADILRTLPMLISDEEYQKNILEDEKVATKQREVDGGGGLKIAWRYQESVDKQRDKQLLKGSAFSHSFDLSKHLPVEQLDFKQIEMLNVQTINQSERANVYHALAVAISRAITTHGCWNVEGLGANKNVLRIVLHSAHSPLWALHQNKDEDFIKFLHTLRGMLRGSNAVCLISVPMHTLASSLCRRIEHLADTILSLQSFQDESSRPDAYREYTGLFGVRKLPRINSLTQFVPETINFGFMRKKKKLYIEKLHLPPEISRSSSTPATAPDMLCAKPTQRNPLDF